MQLGEEEGHLTPTKTNSFAFFILEKLKFDLFEMDIGGRFESVNLKTTTYDRGFFQLPFLQRLKEKLFQTIISFFWF